MHSQRQTSGNLALDQNNVIVIEATQRPEAQKLRVAAYCRVSSDSSDQMNSFAAQMNYYTTLISGKANWTLVDLYADAGISGTSAEKRPDFQRLLSDCRKGRIDKILVKSISRFARNTMDCLKTIRELKAIGVGVCFEEQNIDTSQMTGELLTAAFSAIAQKESESISQNIRWSYRHRMESGTFLPSSVPFGYRIMGRSLVVDEEQAKVVRRIFDSYLAGQSMEAIAASLNSESVPVKMEGHNRTWMYTAISYILSNERYTGDSLWQKTYATDTLPARQVRNHGEREQYYAEATHAPIIDKEVFQAVQELKNSRIEKYGPRSRRQSSSLGQKVFCGECGSRFRKKVCRGVVYWACLGHDKERQTCSVQQIPETELYAAFLRLYHKLRLHGEPILKQMISNLQSVQERRMLWNLEVVELNKRISDISDQDRTLASLNKLGLVDPDIFITQSNQLAQQLRAAKLEKEKVLGTENDDTLSKTQELLELLETMPEFLPDFDEDIFAAFLDAQRKCYVEQINGNPDWTMAGIFADMGDSRSARPQFKKMLRKCRQKKIDLILVRSVSRFARCMAECLNVVRELRELGVEVIFEKEDIHTLAPNSDMLLSLTAVFARAECENLTRNSVHRHYMTLGSRPAKGTWKKTIRLPGRPDKTIIFKME